MTNCTNGQEPIVAEDQQILRASLANIEHTFDLGAHATCGGQETMDKGKMQDHSLVLAIARAGREGAEAVPRKSLDPVRGRPLIIDVPSRTGEEPA